MCKAQGSVHMCVCARDCVSVSVSGFFSCFLLIAPHTYASLLCRIAETGEEQEEGRRNSPAGSFSGLAWHGMTPPCARSAHRGIAGFFGRYLGVGYPQSPRRRSFVDAKPILSSLGECAWASRSAVDARGGGGCWCGVCVCVCGLAAPPGPIRYYYCHYIDGCGAEREPQFPDCVPVSPLRVMRLPCAGLGLVGRSRPSALLADAPAETLIRTG